MLFDGSNALFQPLDTFLDLTIGELNKCPCLSELFFKEGSILGMTAVEMHLKSFGNKLEFVTKPFRQNTSVPFGVRKFSSNGVGRCSDEPLDLFE